MEAQWAERRGAVGRWSVQVRGDGTRVGEPQFQEFSASMCGQEHWDRLVRASQRLCEETKLWPSIVARIYCGKTRAEEYVNAWVAALEQCDPLLMLAHTVEVQTLSGRTIGLVVLPSHPLRVAWHMGYDQLAQHARYDEPMKPTEVVKALAVLDSSSFPWILPGLTRGSSFVFGDTLGFFAVAMVSDQDEEPKAAISQMAACVAEGESDAAPSVSRQMADVLGKELDRYLQLHPPVTGASNVLHINAVRPGDGATITRALGNTVGRKDEDADGDNDADPARNVCFVLEMYPADADSDITGNYLTAIAERRRCGAGGIEAADRWMLESLPRPGGTVVPRLRWARRDASTPLQPAHLSVAFDTLAVKVTCIPAASAQATVPLHGYGLTAVIERRFAFTPTPRWESFLSPDYEGEKHPASRQLTDRLLRLHQAVLSSVARNLDYGADYWPVVRTEMSAEGQEKLTKLHNLSDCVVTIDRNAGVEFFDSPQQSRAIYDAYLIDCVPERDDLGSLQLITSTTKAEEVRDLLDATLAEMGLSSSLRNCEFLLEHLKALSGRLAIRLTSPTMKSGELVALALVHASCSNEDAFQCPWLPGKQGFFVPLDDVRDLEPPEALLRARERRPCAPTSCLLGFPTGVGCA